MFAGMRKCVRSAFSLIEMLVVVAVILIIAGLLFPALSKAKEWGRSARCAANLHQLQLATMNLATDGNRLPWATSCWEQWGSDEKWHHRRGWVDWYTWPTFPSDGPFDTRPVDGSYGWRESDGGLACITNGSLWSYARQEKGIYCCPTFAMKAECRQSDPVRSYAMNSLLNWQVYFAASPTAVKTVLFRDDTAATNATCDAQFTTNTIGRWHWPKTNSVYGKGNAVYLDGHVEKLQAQ